MKRIWQAKNWRNSRFILHGGLISGRGAAGPYDRAMHPVLAVVWHFWIAVLLVIPTILLVIGIGVQYLRKVEMPRYPKD